VAGGHASLQILQGEPGRLGLAGIPKGLGKRDTVTGRRHSPCFRLPLLSHYHAAYHHGQGRPGKGSVHGVAASMLGLSRPT